MVVMILAVSPVSTEPGSAIKSEGNFRALLKSKAEEDRGLSDHLASAPANARYTRPQVQNIIQIIGDKIRSKSISEVQTMASGPAYTVIADETPDVTQTEQLNVCIRYANDAGTACEKVIGFWDLHSEAYELDIHDVGDGEVP